MGEAENARRIGEELGRDKRLTIRVGDKLTEGRERGVWEIDTRIDWNRLTAEPNR